MQRLVQAGFPMNAVTKLFLTHLHSDHVVDVPDLILTPWSAQPERKVPLEAWGPKGTRAMMRHLQEAFAFYIRMRRNVDESFSPDGIHVVAHDIREGKVYDKNGVTVTAFLVTYGLVKPSYGYRIDYGGRSVALSGDTSPSDTLVAFCNGVDVPPICCGLSEPPPSASRPPTSITSSGSPAPRLAAFTTLTLRSGRVLAHRSTACLAEATLRGEVAKPGWPQRFKYA
jgi:phosphoribosyl 1,2-cyclic phosphodiesterase